MVDFTPLDFDRDWETLVDLNEEYLTWAGQMILEKYNVDYFSKVDQTIRQYAESTVDEFVDYRPPNGICYILKSESDVVGMGTIRKLNEGVGEIKRMYVRPQFRGKGIGKALLQELLNNAEEFKFSTIRLDSGAFMKDAQRLYRKFGFVEIEEYPQSEIPSDLRHLWIFMEKRIP